MHLRQLCHLRIQGATMALHAEVFVVICGDFMRMLWELLQGVHVYMNIVMGIAMNFMYISEDFMGLYEDIL